MGGDVPRCLVWPLIWCLRRSTYSRPFARQALRGITPKASWRYVCVSTSVLVVCVILRRRVPG